MRHPLVVTSFHGGPPERQPSSRQDFSSMDDQFYLGTWEARGTELSEKKELPEN